MTILAVQCRLSSTRLQEKALLPLAGKPVLSWVLSVMKKVPADRYFLATDESSAEKLSPLAQENGFECFVGPRDDVLERFCLLIKNTNADTVIRATGDNPFLLYEAAEALVTEFFAQQCDYCTWTGLPHGSGVEMFRAKTLLEAAARTQNPFDHEHAGPAIAHYPDIYRVVKLPAKTEWHFPEYRTTIDTPQDYEKALHIVRAVFKKRALSFSPASHKTPIQPFTATEILSACSLLQKKILLIPSVKKGRGTGHLRRCVLLADTLCADVFIPKQADLSGIAELIEPLSDFQIKRDLPQKGEYALIVADFFALEKSFASDLCARAPLVSIDDGSDDTSCCDYLLDIIPACDYNRKPNVFKSSFIPLPKNRREPPKKIDKVLVVIGGEDPAGLTVLTAAVLNTLGLSVTAVVSDPKSTETIAGIRFVKPIENLIEKLSSYDLVVTHYGFTAFEAVAAGCAVFLTGTSQLHITLSRRAGFTVLPPENITPADISKLLKKSSRLFPRSPIITALRGTTEKIHEFIAKTASGMRIFCPLCHEEAVPPNPIVARTLLCTFRRCRHCGILYLSWSSGTEKDYRESYFFEEYRSQYGKTYLEDFAAIKTQGVRRCAIIDELFWKNAAKNQSKNTIPSVLDIGCAYGPFLSAANDAGWKTYGTDISSEAVAYVTETLQFPAVCASFPDFDAQHHFSVAQFDAVSMWFVIEHFKDLDSVLKAVSRLVKTGGIFAFSTPSASGVSGLFRRTKFFQNSPVDHFTLWEPRKTAAILHKYGFRVTKIISTGQHPERFPFIKKNHLKPDTILYKTLAAVSKFFALGDTFEVYCIKI